MRLIGVRRALVACAAAALSASLLGASAFAGATTVRISYVTPTVSPGGIVTIKASSRVPARCTAMLRFGGQTIARLGPRELMSAHGAMWFDSIARNAKPGEYRAVVSCSRGARVSATFQVGAARVAPAHVSVVKSGFSTDDSLPPGEAINCGVELQNTSTSDARDVTVNLTFTDTQGRSLTTGRMDLNLIPAGETFYASCSAGSNVTLSVAAMKVTVNIGESTPAGAELPPVSGVTLTDDYGTETLTGNLTNPYPDPMSEEADIYAVYFDASGNIVGGGGTVAGASIQPGATVGFSIRVGFGYPFVASPDAASAEVSVDPCGFDATLSTCPALP